MHHALKMAQLGERRDDQKTRPDNENYESSTDKSFSLHDLTNDDKPHELFISEMQHIFQYGMKDILKTITELDMDVLSSIHNTLADMAKTSFPKFKDRRAVQRRVAHTAAKDIRFLGIQYSQSISIKRTRKDFQRQHFRNRCDYQPCYPTTSRNGSNRIVNSNDER